MDVRSSQEFAYLTIDEKEMLQEAFVAADVTYDLVTRARLLDGVNRTYIANFLQTVSPDPNRQLISDLRRMNKTERLADGTVPLAQWLRNVLRLFRTLPLGELFGKALAKVTAKSETTSPMLESGADLGDFEEIITDDVDDLQDVSFLKLGVQRLPAVARLLIPRFDYGKRTLLSDGITPAVGSATGWLIGSDLLLTNYHAIRNRASSEAKPVHSDVVQQALGTVAQLFYETSEDVGQRVCISSLIAFGTSSTQDYALLRLEAQPGVSYLPIVDEQVQMPPEQQTPKGTAQRAFAVNIIQHPGGRPKRVALRNNLVFKADYPKLHYFADTLEGSSGSPVFNDNWRVIAMHRAFMGTNTQFNGKMLGFVNEGIQIHAIMLAIAAAAQTNQEIETALKQIRAEQKVFEDD